LGQAAAKRGKCFVTVWINEWLEGPGIREAERHPNVIVFRSMDRAFQAIAAWTQRSAARGLQPSRLKRVTGATAREKAAAILASVKNEVLTEGQAKQVLACYDVPVTLDLIADTEDQAAEMATRIGFPVVLKLESPDVP